MNQELSNIPNSESAVNPAVLESLRAMLGNDEEVFTKVIKCYLAESPEIVEDMSTSIKNQNPKMLERTAHKLKSSSASMGAVTLYHLCLQMEIMGKSGSFEGSLETLSQLAQEYKKVESVLKQTINDN
jgi:HPt (histidine-containing phosphotransfer) domain-containing protein